ncbi:MAG TPA: heterodisulfide reductase, subunit B, partial [Thermoplasmata archaeon]|nr:heterodisulfide reductase, subunit B [Thermoplasmata archaeon]
ATARAVLEALGHELREMEEWNCCGVVSSLTTDDLMHHIAPLRNLVHVEDEGMDRVIVVCDMCANTLKQTNRRVRENPDDLETLNAFMDRENDYRGTVTVQHLLEFLRDEVGFAAIRKRVVRPLKGMRIMPYYGCMLLRPREVAIDDAEEPRVLADLIEALGGEVVDSPYKIECCGAYRTIDQKEATSRRAQRITAYALERGAEAIALSCPLCRYNLDVRGKEAEALFPGYTQIPVIYYTQLMSIAIGLDIENCGFETHAVDPTPLLREKGVIS